jgi:hypothetical protein
LECQAKRWRLSSFAGQSFHFFFLLQRGIHPNYFFYEHIHNIALDALAFHKRSSNAEQMSHN